MLWMSASTCHTKQWYVAYSGLEVHLSARKMEFSSRRKTRFSHLNCSGLTFSFTRRLQMAKKCIYYQERIQGVWGRPPSSSIQATQNKLKSSHWPTLFFCNLLWPKYKNASFFITSYFYGHPPLSQGESCTPLPYSCYHLCHLFRFFL